MEQKGDFALFYCTKGTLAIHKDIPQYSRLSRKLHDDCNKFIASISLDTLADEPASCVADLMKRLEQYVTDMILAKLIGLGIYDATLEDFTQNNPAYAAMLQATQDHLDVSQNTITSVYDEAAQQKRSALDSAKSSITGPKHGMISNDPFVLGFYEARAERETGEQLSRAKMIYESAVSAIDYNAKQTVNKIINENALKNLFPAIVNSIILFFSDLLQKYTILLSSHGHFDLSCLEDIDVRKSNNILKNLEITDSKRNTIFCALKACPFNVNIFYAMVDNQLPFEAADKDLLAYLDMTDMVCDYITSKVTSPYAETTYPVAGTDLFQKRYDRYYYHIECIANLKKISLISASQLLLRRDIDAIFEPFVQLSGDNTLEIIDYLDLHIGNIHSESAILPSLESYVKNTIIKSDLWEFLQENCGIDVSERLSCCFHTTIQNPSELKSLMVDKLIPYGDKLLLQQKLHSLEKELKSVQDEKGAVIAQQPADQRSSRGFLGLFIVFLFFDIACVVACCILEVFGFFLAVCLAALLILALYSLSKWRAIADYENKVKQFDDTITRLNGQLAEITTQLKTQ